jgi:hypothetical protein
LFVGQILEHFFERPVRVVVHRNGLQEILTFGKHVISLRRSYHEAAETQLFSAEIIPSLFLGGLSI